MSDVLVVEVAMTAHWWKIAWVAAIGVACLSTVHADMRFERAEPAANSSLTAPPPSVQVWLTEGPEFDGSALTLRGPAGPIALTGLHVMAERSLMAMVADKMPDGVYTVAWRAAGRDRIVRQGEFTFTLKRAPAA